MPKDKPRPKRSDSQRLPVRQAGVANITPSARKNFPSATQKNKKKSDYGGDSQNTRCRHH